MASGLTYSPAPLILEERDAEEERDVEEPRSAAAARISGYRRALLVSLGAALPAALVVALLLGSQPAGAPLTFPADGITYLQEVEDPCNKFPFIRLDEVLHSNLGNQGPDTGDEGIVFRAKDIIPSQPELELLITVNATDAYQAGHASMNGIHGKYGLITVKPGNEAEFTFKVLDPVTRKAKTLAKQEVTFFDLDQSASGDNQEYVEAEGFTNLWLTKNTEIVQTEVDGKTRFTSSQPGSGADNPKDPTALTVQQKNRAVSLEYKDFAELKFTMGCGTGRYARYFMFVLRPSLVCATTMGDVAAGEDDVISVIETTLAPSTAVTTAAPEKDYWFIVPLWKWQLYVPSFKFEAVPST